MECRFDEDLTGDNAGGQESGVFTRNEDATMPCFKILGEEDEPYTGVSKIVDNNRFQNTLNTRNLFFDFCLKDLKKVK